MDQRIESLKCKPGDVLLVQGLSPQSKALAAAQKVLYWKALSSHVEFSLSDGVFVHAMKEQGVTLTNLPDELRTIEHNWRVIRLKGLSGEQYKALSIAGHYYLKQGYNKAFMGSGSETSSFCSELIAKIYAKAGISILDDKQPSKVTPSDFDKQADKQDAWEDVTTHYKEILVTINKYNNEFRQSFNTIQAVLNRRAFHSPGRDLVLNLTQQLNLAAGNQASFDAIEKVKKRAKESRTLAFWNEKDMDPFRGPQPGDD